MNPKKGTDEVWNSYFSAFTELVLKEVLKNIPEVICLLHLRVKSVSTGAAVTPFSSVVQQSL